MTLANVGAIQGVLETAGIQFIPENGGGPGVRLRHPVKDGPSKDLNSYLQTRPNLAKGAG
ncbi:hypothetical protein [Microvirga sp. P5_D2]